MSIFICNKYYNWYYSIITNAKNQDRKKLKTSNPEYVYYELHHIIPRSLGGSDEKDNLVLLTAKEHFICHCLLIRMCKKNTPEYHKMLSALVIMKASPANNIRYINSNLYNTHRQEFSMQQSINQTGTGNSQYGKKKTDSHIEKLKSKAIIRNGITNKFNRKAKILSKFLKYNGYNVSVYNSKVLHLLGFRTECPCLYDELTRIKNMLEHLYHKDYKSIQNICDMYDIPYIRSLERLFIVLGIKKRTLKEANRVRYLNKI